MSDCLFSREAQDDLFEIITFIAAKNPSAARKLIADIQEACFKLAGMPTLGHRRNDLAENPDVLFFCVRKHYLIVYLKGSSPLQVVRVLHGARDAAAELASD